VEFTIDLGKQEKKREKNLVSRLDALEDETALDLPSLAQRLDALVKKFNKNYALVNFQMAYCKNMLYDFIDCARVDGVESDMLSFDESVMHYKDGGIRLLNEGYTGKPKTIRVVYKHDFASILVVSEKQEHVLYTWSNKVFDMPLQPQVNYHKVVERLTHRILNCLITTHIKEGEMLTSESPLMRTIKYLYGWLDGLKKADKKTVISHWKYGLGFVKLNPVYKETVAKINKEMEMM
jgi:hypothetical protein